MAFPTYPAVTLPQAEELIKYSGNQLHDIINGTDVETIDAEDGPIPSVRKVFKDQDDIFQDRIAGMAFTRVGTFAAGYTLTDARQVLLYETDGHEYGWAGAFPKVVPPASTPAGTGGVGAGAWVDRSDVTLRDDIGKIKYRVQSFDDIQALSLSEGDEIETESYYAGVSGGGCSYMVYAPSTTVNLNGRSDQNASYYSDTYGVPTISNGNIAIPVSPPSFRRWGVLSDSVTYNSVGTDCSANAQELIDFCAKTSSQCFIESGKYYVHDLIQRKIYSSDDATGGLDDEQCVMLKGESKNSSAIYTNGNDFIDLYDINKISIEDLTILSDRQRIPSLGDPLGKCIFSSHINNYVFARLRRVEIQRFEYGVYSPTGSWSSKYNDVSFKYCKTGLKVERSYNSIIENCNFVCKTAIECYDNTSNSFSINNNHFALGTYCSVFGGVDSTIRVYIDSADIISNYFEAYAPVDSTAIIFDIKVTQTARGSIKSNYMNAALYSPIIRRIVGISAAINTKLAFSENRFIVSGTPKLWEDDGLGTNIPIYIFDDITCQKAPSNIKAMNMQKISSRKASLVISSGETSKLFSEIIDTTKIGDAGLQQNDNLYLPVGNYEFSVYSRSSSVASVTLRLSKSGVNVDFPIAINGSMTLTTVQTLVNPFSGEWDITLINALAGAETATIFDLVITMTPKSVSNTLI